MFQKSQTSPKKMTGYVLTVKTFKIPIYVTIGEHKIKAYCDSVNSIVLKPTEKLEGEVKFIVHTPNGTSNEFVKTF